MADADHTARARPSVSTVVPFPAIFHRPARTSTTWDDVTQATQAIVHVLAQCLAARERAKRDASDSSEWSLPPQTVVGLSYALQVLKEREEALCRAIREGHGA